MIEKQQKVVAMVVEKIKSFIVFVLNSIYYLFLPRKLFVGAWVKIRFGKLVVKNWGDDINIPLLKEISRNNVVVCNESFLHSKIAIKNYICIGSIIGLFETNKSIIWGAGAISDEVVIKNTPGGVCSVRGPLTRDVLLRQGIPCPPRYGDPVLLMSKFYPPTDKSAKSYKLGIVAHYTDRAHPAILEYVGRHQDDAVLIDMEKYVRWEEVPDKICSCKCVISSSLHGLIVADSYGIPNVWVSFYGKLTGGDFKFHDYLLSVGRDVEFPNKIQKASDIDEVVANIENLYKKPDVDLDTILDSCPFYNKL